MTNNNNHHIFAVRALWESKEGKATSLAPTNLCAGQSGFITLLPPRICQQQGGLGSARNAPLPEFADPVNIYWFIREEGQMTRPQTAMAGTTVTEGASEDRLSKPTGWREQRLDKRFSRRTRGILVTGSEQAQSAGSWASFGFPASDCCEDDSVTTVVCLHKDVEALLKQGQLDRVLGLLSRIDQCSFVKTVYASLEGMCGKKGYCSC